MKCHVSVIWRMVAWKDRPEYLDVEVNSFSDKVLRQPGSACCNFWQTCMTRTILIYFPWSLQLQQLGFQFAHLAIGGDRLVKELITLRLH